MWETVKLSEIADISTGTTPPTKVKEYYGGDIPFVKAPVLNNSVIEEYTDFLTKEGATKSRIAPESATLVCCIGATIGKTGFTKKEVAFNQQINALVPHSDINPLFLFFYTQSQGFQNELKSKANVTTLPIINKSTFSELRISVPTRKEQANIANILINVKEKRNKLNIEIKKYQQLKNAVLEKLFCYGIKQMEEVIQTSTGIYPSMWKKLRLSDIATKHSNVNIKDKSQKYYYIDVSAISSETFTIESKKQDTLEHLPGRARRLVNSGDTIFATIRPGLKRIAYIEEGANNIIVSTAFCVIRPDINYLIPKYIYFLLQRDSVIDRIVKEESGASYPAVRDRDIFNIELSIPDLKEQAAIVDILESLDIKIRNTIAQCNLYDILINSLLTKLMNQEIDVSNLEIQNA